MRSNTVIAGHVHQHRYYKLVYQPPLLHRYGLQTIVNLSRTYLTNAYQNLQCHYR